jgi:nucleoid-associated protein YgaU
VGIFDSIKNALGKSEPEPDVTIGPSQMLRDAGLDPSGLKFNFGNQSITVSGEIAEESQRQQILDILAGAPGITQVEDRMTVAVAVADEPPAEEPAAEEVTAESPPAADEGADEGGRTYTVESGDTLWKIAEQHYGNGARYMVIFEANRDLLDNPDRIFPGQVLKIPDPDS